jgi:resuscitation-promoting factor RpfB
MPTTRTTGFLRLALIAALLVACSPAEVAQASTDGVITVIDGGRMTSIRADGSPAVDLLADSGINLAEDDRVLADGISLAASQGLPEATTTLQVRRAVSLTLIQDGAQTKIKTSAPTVGQALAENGIELHAADLIDPPASTPVLGPVTVTLTPAQLLTVKTREAEVAIRSAAKTVGAALAGSGMALQGADYSLPGESAPLPADGQVKVVRVNESVVLIQKSIPYTTEYQLSEKLELDQQDLLQAGQPGLSVSRVRVRYEDGQETARTTEAETTVRPAQDRILGTGTKIVIHTLDTPSGPLEYWRALHVYATSYSPCRSGGDRCYPGTAGGLPVRRGVIGVVRRWWYSMDGLQVYVPGYGSATISDIGAGIPGTPWIDLGFSDEDYESWHQWVTIYFLTPVPPDILYDLQ